MREPAVNKSQCRRVEEEPKVERAIIGLSFRKEGEDFEEATANITKTVSVFPVLPKRWDWPAFDIFTVSTADSDRQKFTDRRKG